MKIRKVLSSLLFVAFAGVSFNVNAIVLHLDSPGSFGAVADDPLLIADDFNLATESQIDSFVWWGGYVGTDDPFAPFFTPVYVDGSNLVDSFSVALYENDLNSGVNINTTGLVSKTQEASGLFRYELDVTGMGLQLGAGQHYLSVNNSLFDPNDPFALPPQAVGGEFVLGWDWIYGQNGDTSWYHDGTVWTSSNQVGGDVEDLSLVVNGTPTQIPVPPAFLLMLGPLAYIGWKRRNLS